SSAAGASRSRSCAPPSARTTTCCAPSSAGERGRGTIMLRALRVSDLAIIDEVELALGQRADTELVRSGAEEAVVEALFTEVPKAVNEALVAAGLRPSETGGELVVRRVLSAAGRSRAYVNGALAPATLVREIAPYLVRIYGQGEDET